MQQASSHQIRAKKSSLSERRESRSAVTAVPLPQAAAP